MQSWNPLAILWRWFSFLLAFFIYRIHMLDARMIFFCFGYIVFWDIFLQLSIELLHFLFAMDQGFVSMHPVPYFTFPVVTLTPHTHNLLDLGMYYRTWTQTCLQGDVGQRSRTFKCDKHEQTWVSLTAQCANSGWYTCVYFGLTTACVPGWKHSRRHTCFKSTRECYLKKRGADSSLGLCGLPLNIC